MGLKCSRQGYIQEFDFGDVTRLAPEGQSFPATDLLKHETEFGLQVSSSILENGLAAILHDEKLSKRLSASLNLKSPLLCDLTREDVVGGGAEKKTVGKGSSIHLVELPPEGKAANEVFVELPPSQKEKQSYYHSQEIVELPADDAMHDDEEDVVYENTSREISPRCSAPTCSRLRRCLSDGEESNDKSFTSPASSRPNVQRQKITAETSSKDSGDEDTSNDQWLYTLYNFEGKDVVTKQDLSKLMDSICDVIGQSITSSNPTTTDDHKSPSDEEHSTSRKNNVKVHLEIGHRKNSNARTDKTSLQQKTPNKYAPCREYKGMLFPPPNSEEAEKLSNYIEEQILLHRLKMSQKQQQRKQQQKNQEHSSRGFDGDQRRPRTSCKKCKSDMTSKVVKDTSFSSSSNKQSNTCAAATPALRNTVTTQPLIHRTHSDTAELYSENSVSPSSPISGTNTPQSCDEVFYKSTKKRHDEYGVAMTAMATTKKYHDSRRRASAEDCTASTLRFRHSCSCHHRSKTARLKSGREVSYRRTSDSGAWNSDNEQRFQPISNNARSNNNNKMKYPSKCSSRGDSSCEYEPTSPRATSSVNMNKSYDQDRTTDRKVTSRRERNPQRDLLPRNTSTASPGQRPDVWPGCSSSMGDIPAVEKQQLVKESTTLHNVKQVVNMEQLCFCKRMLGLSYPCNHGPSSSTKTAAKTTTVSKSSHTVHHRHKHEHHHYHYYVPRDISAHVS